MLRQPRDCDGGRNHPDDISQLIWLFRYFSDIGQIREAMEIWRETDPHIDRLQQISAKLATEPLAPNRVAALRADISSIDSELRGLEEAFSEALGEADRWANRILLVTVPLVLILAGIITMHLFLKLARRMAYSERELRATLKHAGVGMGRVSRNGYSAP